MNIQQISVENMRSNNGSSVPNQFIIRVGERLGRATYFQSYRSIIAVKTIKGDIILDEGTWDYSVTTGKYRNQFLGENKAETAKKIAIGQYKLANLNK